MKGLLIILLFATCLPVFSQPSGDDILKKVIIHPGTYQQMCARIFEKPEVPYHAFELTLYEEATFSKANLTLIQANKEAVVAAIRKAIPAIDLSKEPEETEEDLNPDPPFVKGEPRGLPYGYDPTSLNPLIVKLIHDLKAIETMPEILALEDRLTQQINRASQDRSITPPRLRGWDISYDEMSIPPDLADQEEEQRRGLLFKARSAQRNLIMLMQILMREAKYEPALNNALERFYQVEIAAKAKKQGWLKYSADWNDDHFIYLELNSSSGTYYNASAVVDIPYSDELRNTVRASAQQWIKEHS